VGNQVGPLNRELSCELGAHGVAYQHRRACHHFLKNCCGVDRVVGDAELPVRRGCSAEAGQVYGKGIAVFREKSLKFR
jgi:hypothetical protein